MRQSASNRLEIFMIRLPPHLALYRQDAEKSLGRGLVKDIEFSGSTYEVLIEDLHTSQLFWVFMQLEETGQIKDAFCSEEAVSDAPCLHLAVAYLSLFGKSLLPLHQRFFRSLWNQLCYIYANRLGEDSSRLLKHQPGYYTFQSEQEETLFLIKACTSPLIDYLENLLKKRPQETEETSLKFSNLSYQELALWREGRPNSKLRYELSYWNDLAKWFLKMQEEGYSYQISFHYSEKNIPNWIHIHFSDLEVGFSLSEDILPLIIPALATVESPLTVHHTYQQGIAWIDYDKTTGVLHIEGEKSEDFLRKERQQASQVIEEILIGDWIFVPNDGFYTQKPHILLQKPDLREAELSAALTNHTQLISSLLKNAVIYPQPAILSYQLDFDSNWNLHINCYLFEPGDLHKGYSRLIHDWAYLDGHGFYHLVGKYFEEVKEIIPLYQVADFITQHRAWLNNQKGFETHVRSVEYQLTYQVNANRRLTFARTLAKTKEEARVQDFGSWVYIEGSGFYAKTSNSFNFLLRPGMSLSAEQIPLFIRMNRDELTLVPGFFSGICPILKAGLKIELMAQQGIRITPDYERLSGYTEKRIYFFDDFIYTEGEGFYELPLELRLPERFRQSIDLEGEELNYFLSYEIERIRSSISYLDPRLERPKNQRLVTKNITMVPERGRGWYRFAFSYQTERGFIPFAEIDKAIKEKQQFIFSEAGLIDLRNRPLDWLRQLGSGRLEQETVLLTALEFIRLNAFDPVYLLAEGPEREKTQELFNELTKLCTPDEPDIGGLVSHLRPYQEVGVRWLWFLYHQHLSGLLCDDMGLGKTHQAMALLVSVYNVYRSYVEGGRSHFLIVCPTSVIYHWQDKLQQFLPGIRVYTFYGTKRSLERFQENYDILLTSYGILRNEKEQLSQIPFEIAIFDEIQLAKNQFSRVYAALLRIKAYMRLGLTGTPIENRLRELKSLFDIILPSYLPAEMNYREWFIKPIEKEQNIQQKELLNRMIKPFVLRRKKEDVLKELPEKIEEISYCDLLPYQHQLYIEVLQKRRRHLIEELQNEKSTTSYLHIFALLSSLKQICDHPAVYLKAPIDYQKYESGKWNLFVELLREARESEQKVVVFSQYLGMLDIIEHYLAEQRIGFASLRGSTQNRKEQVQFFNQNPSCEVFVGSLQAAGLGIDLTAGSVVIHYDRWWNAARENQATDRVHRIGQTRGVQVFKLVTKDTFEEKIDLMIARKGQLIEDIVGVDEQTTLKRFTREELIDLLTFVDIGEEHEFI